MPQTWLTSDDPEIEDVLGHLGWTDAPVESQRVLGLYLGAAKTACIAYAPALPEGAPVPDEWVIAQVMQARNIYNAGGAPTGEGDPSAGGYGIATYPLDWHVQQLLRPRRAVGGVW